MSTTLKPLAFLSMAGTDVRLIDVVNLVREGEMFAHFVVKTMSRLNSIDFGVVLVTAVDDHATVLDKAKGVGIPRTRYAFFN